MTDEEREGERRSKLVVHADDSCMTVIRRTTNAERGTRRRPDDDDDRTKTTYDRSTARSRSGHYP